MALVASMLAGMNTAKPLKVSTSTQNYTQAEIGSLTDLTNIAQTEAPSSVLKQDDKTIVVTVVFNNTNVTTSYEVNSLGVYMEDGTGQTILFGVSLWEDAPDTMPAFTGSNPSTITYKLNISVGDTSQIVIEIQPPQSPSIGQVQAIEETLNTHIGTHVTDSEGVHGIRYNGTDIQVEINGEFKSVAGPSAEMPATNVTYDNETSKLTATNTQTAIDEVVTEIDNIKSGLVNIDDIVFSDSQATSIYSSVKVINGILCGLLDVAYGGNVQTSTVICNYKITTKMFGSARTQDNSITVAGTTDISNGVIGFSSYAHNALQLIFSVPWDSSWTKIEGS